MKALDETLSGRVDELIHAGKGQPLLSTTGAYDALVELAGRVESLEEAIREIALEIEKLPREPSD